MPILVSNLNRSASEAQRRVNEMGFRAAPKMLLVDDDVERTSGNVLVAPLDDEDVVSALAGTVDDRVLSVSLVTYDDLLARDSRSHHTDQQHAVTYAKTYRGV